MTKSPHPVIKLGLAQMDSDGLRRVLAAKKMLLTGEIYNEKEGFG